MKDFLIGNGFVLYATGCSCHGLPKYYRNNRYPDYRIITKYGYGIIKCNGVEIFRTNQIDDFKSKMNELKLTN